MGELINFSESGSNENLTNYKNNEDGENYRLSNPFEPLRKTKSDQDYELKQKPSPLADKRSLTAKSEQSCKDFESSSHSPNPNKAAEEYKVCNEDIKVEIEEKPTKTQSSLGPQLNPIQNSRANSMLHVVRSPIKEENEEDETSHFETPSNSLHHKNKGTKNPTQTLDEELLGNQGSNGPKDYRKLRNSTI